MFINTSFPILSIIEKSTLLLATLYDHEQPAISDTEKRMVLAAQKDSKHFKEIYDKYFEKIFVYIHRKVKDEAIADDLTSQTFYNALVKIHTFKFQGYPFSSWLYKIATNELNMYFRKNSDAIRHLSLQSKEAFDIMEQIEENQHTLKLDILANVLSQLEAHELQLIEWRFFEVRSFKEIGYLLDITDDNAKTKTYRLLEKIKKLMPRFE